MPDFMMIDNVAPADKVSFSSLYAMVEQAEDRMVKGEWELFGLGAATGATVRRNRLGFDSLAFRQRILRDVSEIDITTSLLGHALSMPLLICPMGPLHHIHPNAVIDAARAAEKIGIPIATSSAVEPAMETIGTEAGGVKLYQLYIRGDSSHVAESIDRAKTAGYLGIVITADAAYFSIRDYPNKSQYFRRPVSESGKDYGAKVTWETLREIKAVAAPLPVILKGVQTAEDAVLAVEHGIDAVLVSNHGGRELDYCDATISILPEVVAAVAGRVPVLIDGGIRRGMDVVKALALGADAVGIGRLCAWALAAGGEAGVLRMLDILAAEIGNTMGLLGVTKISELDASYVKPAPPVADYNPVFRLRDIEPV